MALYVITGGPCSGKTTLISKLSEMGYITVPESARIIIDEHARRGVKIEDERRNDLDFQKRVLEMKIRSEEGLPKDKTVFLDRGIPDTIAYYRLLGFDVKEIIDLCKERRYKKIFLLEQLPFVKDYARIEDAKTASTLSNLLLQAYSDLGYEIVIVPPVSVKERLDIVLSHI